MVFDASMDQENVLTSNTFGTNIQYVIDWDIRASTFMIIQDFSQCAQISNGIDYITYV